MILRRLLGRKTLTFGVYQWFGVGRFDAFAERHKVGTTVLGPGAVDVAEFVAIARRAQYRRRTTLVPSFSAAPHGRAEITGQVVGDPVVGRHDLQDARQCHHRCSHRGHPAAVPVPPRRHLTNKTKTEF